LKKNKNVKRGKRNRQRGAELQRQAVNTAKQFGLEAYNRDRGGAQHEQGDIEVEDHYYGCKRRKRLPQYIYPEKEEAGVVVRADRSQPLMVLPLERYWLLLSMLKNDEEKEKENKNN